MNIIVLHILITLIHDCGENMNRLVESENYEILYEYEKAFLKFKGINRLILIGEFYGDPYTAIISKIEDFCVVGGEGIIVYYLNEPYLEYDKNITNSKQWMEWGREDETIWIEQIEQVDNNTINLTLESNEQIQINV